MVEMGLRDMTNWRGRRVVIIGAARQGIALARYLANQGARVVLNDRRPSSEFQRVRDSLADFTSGQGSARGCIELVFGGHPLDLLDGTDCICPSGGVPLTNPLIVEARQRGIPFSNDSQIFMEAAPCPVIGITGSAGKTTTTTLVGRMAQATVEEDEKRGYSRKAWVGGNIGLPLVNMLEEIRQDDIVVLELSSFQLEIMTVSPQIAAVLNITPNHLDRHASMDEYTAAKTRILDFQSSTDSAVLGREDPGAWALASKVKGNLLTFGLQEPLGEFQGTFPRGTDLYLRDRQVEIKIMPRSYILLRGEHNLLNVLAACAIGAAAGFSLQAMRAGVEGFAGVPHRLEFVRVWKGASWYNDSIATAPERAMAAIHSFSEPLVLLAGGRDKNLPWEDFVDLVRQRVDHLIVFGEAAEKIERSFRLGRTAPEKPGTLSAQTRPYTLARCLGLKDAILTAAEVVEAGDVVLLSPGGTSFDEFRDFEERGEAFRRWVSEL